VIDLHTHLLPAVDDGSRSVERSLQVLARFAADGVTTVACTPHLRASALRRGLPSRHLAPLAALAALAPPGLALLHGWEILLDEPGAELTAPTLRLGDAPAVLVELPRGPSLPPNIAGELSRIRRSGVLPVVAHPERYAGCTVDDVGRWRAAAQCRRAPPRRSRRRGGAATPRAPCSPRARSTCWRATTTATGGRSPPRARCSTRRAPATSPRCSPRRTRARAARRAPAAGAAAHGARGRVGAPRPVRAVGRSGARTR
jgi:hypothetical protein